MHSSLSKTGIYVYVRTATADAFVPGKVESDVKRGVMDTATVLTGAFPSVDGSALVVADSAYG